MSSQPVSSIFFSVLHRPLGLGEPQACPVIRFPSVVFLPLLLSVLSSPPPLSPFTVPSKMVLARLDERETCPYHFILRFKKKKNFYDGHEFFGWSDCLFDLGTDFLDGNKIFL